MAPAEKLDWAIACRRILEGRSDDPERVFEALVSAAHELTDADGASVVGWRRTGARQLAGSGSRPGRFPAERPTSPITACDDALIVSVQVRSEVDLITWRASGRPPFQDGDIELLRLLAALGGTAVGLTEAALASLYGVARKLLGSRDLDEVLLEVVTTAAKVLRAEISSVFLLAPSGDILEAKASVGHRTIDTARLKVRKGQGLVGHVLQTGEIYRVDDWPTDPVISKEFLPIANLEGSKSSIGAPMVVEGETVGVLAAWRRQRSLFSDGDVEVIRALADLGAVAVQRAVSADAMRDMSDNLRRANTELAQRVSEAEYALRLHERLTRIVVDGAELPTVIDALGEITGKDVAVVGFEGTVIQAGVGWLADMLRAAQMSHSPQVGATASVLGPDAEGRHAIAVKIRSAGFEWAELALASEPKPVSLDVLAAEQAATACAVLLARQDAVAAAVRRLEAEFVWDLLEGRIGSEAEALVRARQLARDLPATARVVLLSTGSSDSHASVDQPAPEQLERSRLSLARSIAGLLDSHGLHARYGRRGQVLAMIIPSPRSLGAARQLCGEVAELARHISSPVLMGVSSPISSITEYPAGYRQAVYAMRASRPDDPAVSLFEDLGVLQFLLEPADRADLERYVTQILGPLIDYDREHGSHLVDTVAAYLQCDCHLQRAAAMIFVHHKTMTYRLARVSALTGLQLYDQEDRFRLHLALKILGLPGGRPPLTADHMSAPGLAAAARHPGRDPLTAAGAAD
jgi:sugar diacid utilization regulator/putative methionine-R-sulfoxide reductase with GAF domain